MVETEAAFVPGTNGIRQQRVVGKVAFRPEQIKSATGNRGTFDPSDPNITHLTSAKPATRAATPLQTLGSRLSAQAKHAALREYLSDDRPQGDTHYTSRSRR